MKINDYDVMLTDDFGFDLSEEKKEEIRRLEQAKNLLFGEKSNSPSAGMIPDQFHNPDLRFCLTEFPMNGSKKPKGKDLDPFGREWNKPHNLLNISELPNWLDRGYGIGIMGGYGNLLVVDIDEYESKDEIYNLLQNKAPTFGVQTASGKYHLYYYCNGDFQQTFYRFDGYNELANGRKTVKKKPILEFFNKEGSKQCLSPINNKYEGKKYSVHTNKPIATIEKEVLFDILKAYQGLDKDPDNPPEETQEVVHTKNDSALVSDIENKLNILNVYGRYTGEHLSHGQRPTAQPCPECNNNSSSGNTPPNATVIYDTHIQCSRCKSEKPNDKNGFKKWNMWSYLKDWCNISDKFERVKLLAEYAGIDINDPKYKEPEEPDPDLNLTFIDPPSTDEGLDELYNQWESKLQKASAIAQLDIPEPEIYINGLLYEGVTLLMAAEKVGKSTLCRQIALHLTSEGQERGYINIDDRPEPYYIDNLLYVSYEDDDKGFKKGYNMLTHFEVIPNEYSFDVHYDCPRLNEGGDRILRKYIEENPNTKFIIIDTWGFIRSKRGGEKHSFGQYDEDINDIKILRDIFKDTGVNIIIVTHTTKSKNDNVLHNVHGGVGQTASVNNIVYIDKKHEEEYGRLFTIGKYFGKKQWMCKYDADHGFLMENLPKQYGKSEKTLDIWDVFCANGNIPMERPEIIEGLSDINGMGDMALKQKLYRMNKKREIVRVSRGLYQMPKQSYDDYIKVYTYNQEINQQMVDDLTETMHITRVADTIREPNQRTMDMLDSILE